MKNIVQIKLARVAATVLLATMTTILSVAQNIRSTKTLKLKGYDDQYAVALEYDSAVVLFSLMDVRDELTKLKSEKKISKS